MRTTFRILYPTLVNNNICGETLNNISNTATIRIYNVLGDIVPLQTLSTLQSTPTSGNALLQDGRISNVGVSYDINTSKLTAATNGRGGFEISVIYIFKKIVPFVAKSRVCPIYM